MTMKLESLFNRRSKKQQDEYIVFRNSLKKASVNTRADTDILFKNIRQRFIVFNLLIILTALALLFFLPNLKMGILIFAILAIIWAFTTILKGRNFLRQYIEELGLDEKKST